MNEIPEVSAEELEGTVSLDVSPARPGMSDETAELAVLAGVLTLPECLYDVIDLLTPEDFASAQHASVWRAVLACEQQGRPVDVITVADELKRAGALKRVGGVGALERIVEDGAPFAVHVVAHAQIVAECALARRVLGAGREIAKAATDLRNSGQESLEFAERRVFELSSRKTSDTLIPMADAVPPMLEELAKLATGDTLLGMSTGFGELDRLTGGAQPGQLIIVAARPAMGKSALALGLARALAEARRGAVVFLSYEMSTQELMVRKLSALSGLELHLLRQGQVPPEMEKSIAVAARRMQEMPLFIDDNPPETVTGVRSALMRLSRQTPVAAVVVDYLQLMSGDRRSGEENRVQEVGGISRGLKKLAREMRIPVFALSQLNRGLESRPNKRPMLSDLRDSGSLEQDADTVWFLYRDAVYHPESDPSSAELIIAKQRNGPTGVVPLEFLSSCAKFVDRAPDAGAGNNGQHSVPRVPAPSPRRQGGGTFF